MIALDDLHISIVDTSIIVVDLLCAYGGMYLIKG